MDQGSDMRLFIFYLSRGLIRVSHKGKKTEIQIWCVKKSSVTETYEWRHEETNNMVVCQEKTQISLVIN